MSLREYGPISTNRRGIATIFALFFAHRRKRVMRVKCQNESATAVAKALCKHPPIKRVLYRGLKAFPGHEIAAAQMSGFGGMVTIELNGSAEVAARVVDRLKLFVPAPSLGGVEAWSRSRSRPPVAISLGPNGSSGGSLTP